MSSPRGRYVAMSPPPTPNQVTQQIPILTTASPDLTELLSYPKTTVRSLLRENTTYKLLLAQHPQLIKYMADHISKLVELAFRTTDPEIAKLAYGLLQMCQRDITDALCTSIDLSLQANEVLKRTEIDPIALNRIGQLTFHVISTTSSLFPPNCIFILDFLNFIGEMIVFGFFENIFAENPVFEPAQRFLIENGVGKRLLKPLSEWNGFPDDGYGDSSCERIRNSLRLFRLGLKNVVLQKHFIHPTVVQLMFKNMGKLQSGSEDERWVTFVHLYLPQTVELLRGLFHRAFDILGENYVEIRRCHVAIIEFFTEMVKNDPTMRSHLLGTHQIFIRLLMQFPMHTFLVRAIVRHISVCIQFPETRAATLSGIVGAILYENELHYIAFAVCESMVADFKNEKELASCLQHFDGLREFMETEFKNYKKVMSKGYGGRIQTNST